MFFYVHQSHRRDNTHPSLFASWGVLWHDSFLTCVGTIPSGTRTPIIEVSYSADHEPNALSIRPCYCARSLSTSFNEMAYEYGTPTPFHRCVCIHFSSQPHLIRTPLISHYHLVRHYVLDTLH